MFSILNSYDYKNQFTEKKLELPFLGEYESLENFKFIYIYAYSEKSDIFELQFSNNQNDINYEFVETYTISGGNPPIEIILPKRLRYFRFKITTPTFNKNDRRTFSIFLFDSQYIKTSIKTDPSGSPIVALDANIVASVLPNGAATETTLVLANSSINTVNTTIQQLTLEQNSTTNLQKGTLIQGSTSTINPTYITGKTNPLSLTTAGALRVDNSAVTQPVSGTINVSNNFATEPTLQQLTLEQDSTTNLQKGTLIQGSTSTTNPTYTTGKTNPLSLTTAGALRVDNSAVTQPVSGTINVSNNFATESTLQQLTLEQNSTTNLQKGTLIQGSTSTINPTYITGKTNPLSLTTAGALRVDNSAVTQPVSGTINVSNNFATESTLQQLTLEQDSTTNLQKGTLIQGSTSTTNPTYTTGKTNPLSLTTAGALRVDNSAVTQPISGTINVSNNFATESTLQQLTLEQDSTTNLQKGTLIQGSTSTTNPTYTTGKTNPLSLTTAGALRVEISSKPIVIMFEVGPILINSGYCDLDVSDFKTFDILIQIPNTVNTTAGIFTIQVSDNNIDWYSTNISITIPLLTPSNGVNYWSTYSNTFNTQYVRLYSDNTLTTDNVIKIKYSLKK